MVLDTDNNRESFKDVNRSAGQTLGQTALARNADSRRLGRLAYAVEYHRTSLVLVHQRRNYSLYICKHPCVWVLVLYLTETTQTMLGHIFVEDTRSEPNAAPNVRRRHYISCT